MATLSSLKPNKGSRHRIKKVGRGNSSGHGGTSCRGHKGQLARSGPRPHAGFEGGQMPLHRRSPKWGFTNTNKQFFNVLNLSDLERAFSDGEEVTQLSCTEKGLLRRKNEPIKILAKGELKKSLKVEVLKVSKKAKEAIEAAKGSVTLEQKAS